MEDNFIYSSITSNQENVGERCIVPNVWDRVGTLSTSAANSKRGSLEVQRNEISNTVKVCPYNGSFEDVSNGKVFKGEDIVSARNLSLTSNWETDALWFPPEPEDTEDDKEDSVANSDDDDDNYSDGTKWSQPSSLSRFSGGHAFGSNYEERKKAMKDAMNGQFMFLVSRFLASEGINCSKEDSGKSWLDIVAALSWEAALMIKPDVNEGREMDPASYVKVKCVAHGCRDQSEVVKGLVFKKNTAHKHMPTNVRNPRLLLLKGVLGEHRAGLSSFNSLMQDNNDLKSLIEVIETCNPNVILVEKTASRDVQEKLLDKKITLVFDMKLARLEKIARCTASSIISGDNIPMSTKLRQCDYFHIEKLMEEHNHTEGGKKPSKTLMFFEGCPKPLGCTILLRGAHSDELKKVKRVMHYTVFAAYHLILETSFFVDQRAISCAPLDVDGQNSCTNQFASSATDAAASTVNSNCSTSDGSDSTHAVDISIFDESIQKPVLELVKSNSDIENAGSCADITTNASVSVMNDKDPDVIDSHALVLHEKHNESSLPRFPGQHVSSVSSVTGHVGFGFWNFFTSYISYPGNDAIIHYNGLDNDSLSETVNIETEYGRHLEEVKAQDELSADAKIVPVLDLNESLEHVSDANNQVNIPQKGDIGAVLDPQSILVLFSSRSIHKDTVCEQSHLTRIKYYGNFDISVGRFLQDILLSEKRNCVGCGALPESHIYSYTHQNGKLTVQVKQLPPQSHLHGAAQGKIWMWTRCLKCHHERGIPRPTRRVVMSTAARGLSFGKFLELSFSEHSAARRLSRCGHLLHRDCLRFFGLGSKVAMFKYSQVDIFTACKPPPLLEFSSPTKQEWFEKGAKDVRESGGKLFSNIESSLQEASSEFSGRPVNLPGSSIAFSEVMEMLNREKLNFEKVTGYHEISSPSMYQLFDLTYLKQELLLQLYVWDSRLQSLLTSKSNNDATDKKNPADGIYSAGIDDENSLRDGEGKMDNSRMSTMIEIEESSCGQSNISNVNANQEINSAESLVEQSDRAIKSIEEIADEKPGKIIVRKSTSGPIKLEDKTFLNVEKSEISFASSTSLNDDNLASFEIQVEKDVAGHTRSCNSNAKSGLVIDHGNFNEERLPSSTYFADTCDSERSVNNMVMGPQDWIWNPFQEIRKAFWKDYSKGFSHKYRFIFSYSPEYLPALHQLNAQERERLCYPVDEVVICLHEEEISSIIACALALYHERFVSPDEMEVGKDRARVEHELEDAHGLASDGSSSSSTGSMNLERIQSWQSLSSISSDELSTSGADGSLLVDRLLSSESLHPEIQLGFDNITGRSKYSVVCIYAKEFFALRKHCCPSEIAYMSSLSRCKKWDAKGGKSKAQFAKTLDDRFIIKEIKKTELASFLKFAPGYFKHVTESLKSGSQTCLAKILGIYQVTQNKGGKEIKTDLMVMENLLFGRNVSRTYDLKGALFSRYNSDAGNPDAVLLDQNFVEDMGLSPTYVGGRTKHLLQRAIWNDTSFLTSINVMDYSLLVGVDKERHHLVFGIIDYLRQYTWDKQLENWVKLSLVVPKNTSPTVVSPKEYKKRFRKFMSKYFLTVPDSWATDRGLDACRSCTDIVDSSQTRHSDFRDKSTQLSAGV